MTDQLRDAIPSEVPFWEISPENYFRRGGLYADLLRRVRAQAPVLSHGLTLSLAGHQEPDSAYLNELRALLEPLDVPWHSDHLCMSSLQGRLAHELLPVAQDQATVARVVSRVDRIQQRLGLPLLVENVTYYARPAPAELDDAAFVRAVVEGSGCGLLLDVNNLYVNALNHGHDPYALLAAMPLERVTEVHVAGHSPGPGRLILDTHGAAVCEPVLALMQAVVEQIGPVPVLLERDNDVPALSVLLDERRSIEARYDAAVARWEQRRVA